MQWIGGAAQTLIVLTCVLYLMTNTLWSLLLWETVTLCYLVVGLALVWRGRQAPRGDRGEARAVMRWMWIPPLLAAVVGANAAITAMVAQASGRGGVAGSVEIGSERSPLIFAASAGIILSWMMLQIAFAEVYELIAIADDGPVLAFPSTTMPTTLDYLYFSFTIGTSFATSDVEVCSVPARRIVLLHSIVGFFYNALVVAVAFQVLQGLIAQG